MKRISFLRTTTAVAVAGLILAACGASDDEPATDPVETEEEVEDEPAEDEPAEDEAAEADEATEVEGDEVTLTLGHPFPAGHPIQVGAIEPLADDIFEATNGTVTLEIIPGGALGPGPGVYENTVAGAQDVGWALQGYTPGRFPLTDVVELPFMFESAEQATEVLWTLYEEFPAFQEEYADVHVLGLWVHDVGDLWLSGTQVNTMEDMEGLTLRAPGPLQNALITELGGAAVGMPAPELFDSLERGVIDGLMIAASGLRSFSLFEVLDYGVQIDGYVAAQFLTVELGAWESLSPSQQEAIDEVAGLRMSTQAANVYDAAYEDAQARLEEEGIELIQLDDEEFARWQAAGDVVIQNWIDEREAEGLPGQEMFDRLSELVGR